MADLPELWWHRPHKNSAVEQKFSAPEKLDEMQVLLQSSPLALCSDWHGSAALGQASAMCSSDRISACAHHMSTLLAAALVFLPAAPFVLCICGVS